MKMLNAWQVKNSLGYCLLAAGATGLTLGNIPSLRQMAPIALATQKDSDTSRLAIPIADLPTASAQGSMVTVGNTVLPIPWDKQGDRIGIADLPLLHHLGVELQDTTTDETQPLQWFSEASSSVATWYGNGYRYLDLTDWATQQGWRLIPRGNNLTIDTPTGVVITGRRGQQTWGDRLVLEVDQPVLWSLEEDVTTFTLTVQARAGGSFDPSLLTSSDGNVLNTLEVIPQGNQLELTGTFDNTARPRVWSLTNPDRVVIDVTQADLVPRGIQWAPGIQWRQQYVTVGNRPFPVHQLWLDLSAETQLQPMESSPSQLPGITPLSTMAKSTEAFAAINAGFFNRNNQLPLGAIRRNGQWISGPILNRGAISWNAEGQYVLDRLSLTYILTTPQGATYTVNHINSGYVQAGIGLYTAAWGSTYTPITDGEILITVRQNRVIQQTTTGVAGSGAYALPPEGYLLALRSFNSAVQSLPIGTTVTLRPDLQPSIFADFPTAIGGGPILIQNGRILADAKAEGFSDAFAAQAAPRSAIGVTPAGDVILAAIHYSPGDRGPTLAETAQIMQQLGAQDALNLDGGNSSTLYLGGQVINRHVRTVGRVHNGLGVFLSESE